MVKRISVVATIVFVLVCCFNLAMDFILPDATIQVGIVSDAFACQPTPTPTPTPTPVYSSDPKPEAYLYHAPTSLPGDAHNMPRTGGSISLPWTGATSWAGYNIGVWLITDVPDGEPGENWQTDDWDSYTPYGEDKVYYRDTGSCWDWINSFPQIQEDVYSYSGFEREDDHTGLTDDGSVSASGSVKLVKVEVTKSGHETVNGYDVLRRDLPLPQDGNDTMCTFSAEISPSGIDISSITWTCNANLRFFDNMSQTISGSSSLTNVDVIGVGSGSGVVTCTVYFEKYSWEEDFLASAAASDNLHNLFCIFDFVC